nr:metal ABC transporter substrate-binding protein [uncultured Romboutsia sp.]
MKIKLKKILIILTLVILSITGCSSNTDDNNKLGSNKDKKEDSIKVVTSFYPMYLLASNVVKDIDNVELINMTNSATGCLHDYSLTTDNIKLLEDCDIFIINGAGMESFLDKVLKQKPDLKIIDASKGIELIKSDYMDESDNHDHDHDEEYNPHVWLSVENAIKQVENIKNKLIEYNSINKDKYSQNAKEYIEQLSNLDNKIHSELDNIENKNIVTFHEAFPYFAKEYGLNIVGVVQREAGSEPSAKELQETIEKIKNLDVKAICVEPQYSTKAAETISKETNVKVYTLDPIVTEEYKNSSYIDIMNKNLETLKEAFK